MTTATESFPIDLSQLKELPLDPTQATLTDEQIQDVSNKIITNVEKQTGGTLRA